MSVATASPTAPAAPARPRAELVLGILAILTFGLVPVHINTIYSGLPAHPLFLHVPVILIPLVAIAALALAARPGWFERHGVWITSLTVFTLAATNLTMGAGSALRADLGLVDSSLIARHAHAASILRLLVIAFTAVLLVALAAHRAERPWTGVWSWLNGILRPLATAPTRLVLRLVLAVLAAGCLYFTFHTGDLGAKAVWQGRLSHHGTPGGGVFPGAPPFPGGQLPPSAG